MITVGQLTSPPSPGWLLVQSEKWVAAHIDASGYTGATTCVYVDGPLYTLNARIGEVGAAMGDLSGLSAADYCIQRFR